MKPKIFAGKSHSDTRGTLYFNNDFDASQVKRIYFITNRDTEFIRGWQGHKVEQRWFCSIVGSFLIELIEIDNWEKPSSDLNKITFTLDMTSTVLRIPAGFVSSIKALEEESKLLVMADYALGEINDEYRLELSHFNY